MKTEWLADCELLFYLNIGLCKWMSQCAILTKRFLCLSRLVTVFYVCMREKWLKQLRELRLSVFCLGLIWSSLMWLLQLSNNKSHLTIGTVFFVSTYQSPFYFYFATLFIFRQSLNLTFKKQTNELYMFLQFKNIITACKNLLHVLSAWKTVITLNNIRKK